MCPPAASSGGPANVHGILYQIFRTLGTAARFVLDSTPARVVLTIEPRGGDLHVEASAQRNVVQFKSRAHEATFSLTELIDDVFPDLYLAVDLEHHPHSRYTFSTDGRMGTWARALEFFASFRDRGSSSDQTLANLDTSNAIEFSRGYRATERDLLDRVLSSVRARSETDSEPQNVTVKKVLHLLSNFRFEPGQSRNIAEESVSRLLREMGVPPNDVPAKIDALIGALTLLCGEGRATIEPAELLTRAGLLGLPLAQLSTHARRALFLFEDDLDRAGYVASTQIPRHVTVPRDLRCVCFAGESGQGKTWAMAAAALEIAREYEHIVVFVRARGDAGGDFAEAVEKVSREVLGRAQTDSLRALALDVSELVADDGRPWLTICVDNVQSAVEAANLLANDREHQRVRVMFTAPLSIADGLRSRPSLAKVEVPDFTSSQLRRYLEGYGWEWGDVPADIRRVIERPLLARLFVDVAGDPRWRGTTEYELYKEYWNRLSIDLQADHPSDVVNIRELAVAAATGRIAYPWTPTSLREFGVDDDARRRLERVGWLRREPDSAASIWHDRLLNWAVAEALVARVRSREATIDELAEMMVGFTSRFGNTRFGYVPMDTLWLASASSELSPMDVANLLRALERNDAFGPRPAPLYSELIPTLGARIVPGLLKRFSELGNTGWVPSDSYGACLYAATGSGLADSDIHALLTNADPRSQDIGLAYLRKSPKAAFLDRIWHIHCLRQDIGGVDGYRARERTYAALAACVPLDLGWVTEKLKGAIADQEPVWSLAYLIATLASSEGEQLWLESKGRLLEIVPERHFRSLVRCIHAYQDSAELERLIEWIPFEEDLAGAAAFAAVANLDPERALSLLDTLDIHELNYTAAWWLPWLLLVEPTRTQERIRRRMDQEPGTLRWAPMLWGGNEDAIDDETLESLLAILSREIPAYLENAQFDRPSPLDLALKLLSKCSAPSQIKLLEAHQGDVVEERLVALANGWIGKRYGGLERELKHLQSILQRIGGEGYVRVARESLCRLDSESYISDLDVAIPCVDLVAPELTSIVDRFSTADRNSRSHGLAFFAVRLLAGAGHIDRVLDVALQCHDDIEIDVPLLLSDHGPATDETFSAIASQIDTSQGEARLNAIYSIGLTRRPEAIPLLARVADDSSDHNARQAALFAFDALIQSGVPVDFQHFDLPGDPSARLRGLLHVGTTQALDLATKDILSISERTSPVLDVAAALLDEERGPRIAQWMWPYLRDTNVRLWHDSWWKALGYLQNGVDVLLEHATGANEDARAQAAGILATVSPGEARRVAARSFQPGIRGHESLADRFLGIDEAWATDLLLKHLVEEPDEHCRMSIGRAFRARPSTVRLLLPTLFASPFIAVRLSACEIASWLSEDWLEDNVKLAARRDRSMSVQRAAIQAIQRQREFAAARELRTELTTATGMRAFTLAVALAETADPIVLSTQTDPLCVWPILMGKSMHLKLFVADKLEACAKAVKERADRRTREREREQD